MNKYLIFIDAAADIDLNFARLNDIRFINMQYVINELDEVAKCDDSIDNLKEFYDKVSQGSLAATSQINPFQYEQIFSPLMDKGYSILYAALSSGLSKTYESAILASKSLKEKYPNLDLVVIDSLTASGGIGILAEAMVLNKNNGLSIFENKDKILNLIKKLDVKACVDSLMHLKRGGRIPSSTAIIGSVLNVKPIIKVKGNGKLEMADKKIGFKRAILHLADTYKENGLIDQQQIVYIDDADNIEMAVLLEQKIKAINPKVIIKRRMLTKIIGTHVGTKAIVLAFEGKEINL